MKKKIFLIIVMSFVLFCTARGADQTNTTTLNILVPMRVLDPKLIAQFEKLNSCTIKVEFVSDSAGYESHLRSEIRMFDVVIAPEKSLIQLTTTNLLRMLPENLRQPNAGRTPLQTKTMFNTEVNSYIPLFVNPMGIAYNPEISHIPARPTWNMLIQPEQNPYWRRRVYIGHETSKIISLAILASHEPITNPKILPAGAQQWLSKLRTQRAVLDEPLELAFLGQHVNAGVLFYSDYLRYKNIVPNLEFLIPHDGTYFDRFGIAWCLSSVQDKLAKKFIAYMVEHSAQFAKSNSLYDINYKAPYVTSWKLYDESAVLPFLPAQGADR